MSADPIDAVTGSISDGDPVDWALAESGTRDKKEQASLQALREVERIAYGYRVLHQSAAPGTAEPGDAARGEPGDAARAKPRAMQWGDLTVLELARAGASGEVWRAWDPWLQREVALKFLQVRGGPESAGIHDSALLEEARALARVRHPGVVAVHGIAEHDGRVGMWMEFLEGDTLAAEIERRGALPPIEVAEIGLALCRALEAVEAAGVVHRDIKPANVVLETTGRIVLTDFGLGRRWELADRSTRASGTPIFMSPGVLAGGPATPRTDLYAVGVTLRWALTGHPPFKAQSFEELEIEAKTGPATSLATERPDVSPALIAVIDRAMAPSADDRYAGAAQMAADLERVVREMKSGRFRRFRRGILIATGTLALLAAATLPRLLETPGPPSVARFSVAAPANMVFDPDPVNAVVSPDGLLLAFIATDSSRTGRLWVRPLKSLLARPIEGTEGAQGPFWSPDSRNIGFFALGKLKKVAVSGGAPEVLCAAPDGRGGTWGSTGVIVFAPVPTGPLSRISAEGGPVSEIAWPDSTRHETALRWPAFLPDGKRFLFVSLPAREGGFDVYVSSIDSRERKQILRSDAAPVVAGKEGLILERNGRLMAQRFDFGKLRPTGDVVSLGPSTATDVSVGEPLVSCSMNGVLVQQNAELANTQMVWLDRNGRELGVLAVAEGRYEKMSFSPDGRRLLVVRRGSPNSVDLWAIDLASGLETRLTSRSQSRIGGRPSWSPDGRRVAFNSNRDGPTNIYVKDMDQNAPEKVLYQSSAEFKEVDGWSHDGRFLLFVQADPATAWDLWLLPMQGDPTPIPYLRSSFNDFAGDVSPDGKWLAYWSDESGTYQVYVQTFPTPGEKHLVSSVSASGAVWSKDGRELILGGTDATLWSVPVTTMPTFTAGAAKKLFKYRSDGLWLVGTPDLNRFLICVPAGDVPASTITVELNWPAETTREHGRPH